MAYVLILAIVLVVLPAKALLKGAGRANGWLYDLLREFFKESLQGHRHRNSLSMLLAAVGSVVMMILLVAILLALL